MDYKKTKKILIKQKTETEEALIEIEAEQRAIPIIADLTNTIKAAVYNNTDEVTANKIIAEATEEVKKKILFKDDLNII